VFLKRPRNPASRFAEQHDYGSISKNGEKMNRNSGSRFRTTPRFPHQAAAIGDNRAA
jgi:hypothetical protein